MQFSISLEGDVTASAVSTLPFPALCDIFQRLVNALAIGNLLPNVHEGTNWRRQFLHIADPASSGIGRSILFTAVLRIYRYLPDLTPAEWVAVALERSSWTLLEVPESEECTILNGQVEIYQKTPEISKGSAFKRVNLVEIKDVQSFSSVEVGTTDQLQTQASANATELATAVSRLQSMDIQYDFCQISRYLAQERHKLSVGFLKCVRADTINLLMMFMVSIVSRVAVFKDGIHDQLLSAVSTDTNERLQWLSIAATHRSNSPFIRLWSSQAHPWHFIHVFVEWYLNDVYTEAQHAYSEAPIHFKRALAMFVLAYPTEVREAIRLSNDINEQPVVSEDSDKSSNSDDRDATLYGYADCVAKAKDAIAASVATNFDDVQFKASICDKDVVTNFATQEHNALERLHLSRMSMFPENSTERKENTEYDLYNIGRAPFSDPRSKRNTGDLLVAVTNVDIDKAGPLKARQARLGNNNSCILEDVSSLGSEQTVEFKPDEVSDMDLYWSLLCFVNTRVTSRYVIVHVDKEPVKKLSYQRPFSKDYWRKQLVWNQRSMTTKSEQTSKTMRFTGSNTDATSAHTFGLENAIAIWMQAGK